MAEARHAYIKPKSAQWAQQDRQSPKRSNEHDTTRTARAPRLRDGNVHCLETQFRARVQMMIAWEMRREAREIVKRRLKAQGVKVSLVSASTITQLAHAHLRRHAAELLAAAEASGVVQQLSKTFSRASVDPTAKSLNETQVQNGEPK